jgi:hypothetical protein
MSGREAQVRSAVILLAACGLVAGCGAPGASSNRPSPIRYVVCTSTAGTCSGSTMQTEPRAMYLSGDGSFYVVRITWAHWGTATATGKGTAEANNCSPDCADGTFHAHPATITVSDPRTWHGMLAYTRLSVSVPAIRYGYTVTSGLIPGVAPSIAPPPSQPPPSSPSTAALLSTTCTLGFAGYVDGSVAFVADTAANWNTLERNAAEQVTLTNVGTVGATLAGFETETTWHGQVVDTDDISYGAAPNLPEFLTPGQTYSAVVEFSSLSSVVTVTESTYLQSKCSVVTWYQP